jgi:hypothetical protein
MTVTGMERRIRKLESVLPDGLAALTWDELEIHLLEINRVIAARESLSPDEREEREKHIAEIEADIIRMAEEQASPQYQAHLEYCRESWRKRTGRDDYVPALFYRNGFGEYDAWEKPNVMARRAALRASPIVQEVLARIS